MSENEDLEELIIKMARTLPISIEDAARLVAQVYLGHEMPDILNNIKAMKNNIKIKMEYRDKRWQKGCEDGMDGKTKEYGIRDKDYQAGYSFGSHVRTRGV